MFIGFLKSCLQSDPRTASQIGINNTEIFFKVIFAHKTYKNIMIFKY